eukprot:8358136-Pyramimonas_sp.AAC.1
MQHVIPANSPHQNGKCERHGGLVKEGLSKAALAVSPTSWEETDLLLCEVVASKNRGFHRGGYSPSQLVFGQNPRMPRSLLFDDPLDLVGCEDVSARAVDLDTAAG